MMTDKSKPRSRRAVPFSPLVVFALLLAAPAAWGATITVDTLLDDGTDGTACSLREAIGNANDNAATNSDCAAGTGNDTIDFAATDSEDAAVAGGTVIIRQGELTINDSGGGTLTIEGKSAQGASTTLTADDADEGTEGDSRIFNVQSKTTLKDLRLVSGFADGGNGGAIINSAALIVNNGSFNSSQATGGTGAGGAIYNDSGGSVTVKNSTFNGNIAESQGGAIADASGNGVTLDTVNFVGNRAGVQDDTSPMPGDGGALYLPAGGDLTDCSLVSNTATQSGGGVHNGGALTITRSSLSNNHAVGDATGDGGGGIYNDGGAVTLDESSFRGNSALGEDGAGGGILSNGGSIDGGDGSNAINGNRFASQKATHRGGAIALLNGASATFYRVALQSNQAGLSASTDSNGDPVPAEPGFGGAAHLTDGSSLTLDTASLAQNVALTSGGAIWKDGGTLTLDFVQLFNNVARGETSGDGGGAIFNESGDITANNVRFLGNAASGLSDADGAAADDAGSGGALLSNGGGINLTEANINRNSAERAGGAIEVTGGDLTLTRAIVGGDDSGDGNMAGSTPGNGGAVHVDGGTVTIDDSTVAYNTGAQGGGLWNSGSGTLNVNNSTISHNQAVGSKNNNADGGGIFQVGGGTATLRYATVAHNHAGGSGGGIAVGEPGGASVMVESSIVAENSAGSANDFADDGTVTASDSVARTGGAGIRGLQLFGGPTATHPLKDSSPALDIGDSSLCSGTEIDNLDQRGAARPPDGGGNGSDCDAGSYELTDDTVLRVSRNGPDTALIDTAQDDNAVVLAFEIRNPNDSSVTVKGFSLEPLFNGGIDVVERLLANDPDAALKFEVVVDDNGNGELDAGETHIVGQDVADRGATFQFAGGAGRQFSAGEHEDFLVVFRVPAATTTTTQRSFPQAPLYAGGLLLGLLGLVRLRGTRRRTQWLLAIALLTIGLAACSQGEDPIPPPPGPDPVLQGQLRFKMTQLNAQLPEDILIGDGLPIYGPALSVR